MVKALRRAKADEEMTSIRSTGEASNALLQEALPLLRDIHAAQCRGQVPPAVEGQSAAERQKGCVFGDPHCTE